MKHLSVAMGLLSLFACGKFDRIENGGFTHVSFQQERSGQLNELTTTLPYGIGVYAYSASYVTNIKLTDANATGSMVLPNGTYSFYAFGYAYDPSTSGNDIRCAVVQNYTLTGAAQTIDLNFTQASCSNGAFANSASYLDANTVGNTLPNSGAIFPQMDVIHCSTAASVSLGTISTLGTNDCSTMPTTGITAPWSSVSRFQLVVPLFTSDGVNVTKTGEAWRSACSAGSASPSGGVPLSAYLRFPVGASSLPGAFPVDFETFTDSSCTSAPLATHHFNKGLVFGPTSGTGRVLAKTGGTNRLRVFLRQ